MPTMRETVGVVAVLVGAAVLAAVNHHPNHGRRTERERAAVEVAADEVTHQQIRDAWTQLKLGNPQPFFDIQATFPLPPRSTYEYDGAIVLVFDGHDDVCIDLASRPQGRTISGRRC